MLRFPGDLHWHKSPQKGAGASCTQTVHLLLPPSCAPLLQQPQYSRDGETGSLAGEEH